MVNGIICSNYLHSRSIFVLLQLMAIVNRKWAASWTDTHTINSFCTKIDFRNEMKRTEQKFYWTLMVDTLINDPFTQSVTFYLVMSILSISRHAYRLKVVRWTKGRQKCRLQKINFFGGSDKVRKLQKSKVFLILPEQITSRVFVVVVLGLFQNLKFLNLDYFNTFIGVSGFWNLFLVFFSSFIYSEEKENNFEKFLKIKLFIVPCHVIFGTGEVSNLSK